MAGNDILRVLILDDERVIVDTLCMILNQCGFEARGAYTHQAAILAAHEFRPDVLLTGFVNCCEKNGCETAAEVLTFLPDCHIIVCSGQAATALFVDDFNRRGYAFELYPKPIHPQQLLTSLRAPRPAPFVLEAQDRLDLEQRVQRDLDSARPVDAPDLRPNPIRRTFRKIQGMFKRQNAI